MKLSLAFTAIVALALPGCDDVSSIKGSGRLVDARRDVAAFHAVHVSDGLRAEIVVGPQSVDLHLDDNILEHVDVHVTDGRLVLQAKDRERGFDPSRHSVIRVASPAIDAVTATNGADVRAEPRSPEVTGDCRDGANLVLDVRDARLVRALARDGCRATFTGTARDLTLDSSDGSDVDSQVVLDSADIRARDGSAVRARVTKKVRVVASDGSDVRVHGNPAGREVTTGDGASVSFED
jgi:hypothetical protein